MPKETERRFKAGLQLFLVIACCTAVNNNASADRLYEVDLLKQSSEFKAANQKVSLKELTYPVDVASAKAQNGQLEQALCELNSIRMSDLSNEQDFFLERAEIESLLKKHPQAIEDVDCALALQNREYPVWRTLWQKAIILERAGRRNESNRSLRLALANLNHFGENDGLFAPLLRTAAAKRKVEALIPEQKISAEVLAILDSLKSRSNEHLKKLELSAQPEKLNDGEIRFNANSPENPISYLTFSENNLTSRIGLNTLFCDITPAMVRKKFDVKTQKEIDPKVLTGCGDPDSTLYTVNKGSPTFTFLFDSSEHPALVMCIVRGVKFAP